MWKTLIHAALALLLPTVVGAETPVAPEPQAPELRAAPPDEPATEPLETSGVIDLDPTGQDTLDVDATRPPPKAWALPRTDPTASEWKRAESPNGIGPITVKKPLPLSWDTKIGADLNPAASTSIYDRPDRPLPPAVDRGTGAAWLNVAVPNIAAVEVRVNSGEDQSKVGAAFIRSLPLGEKYAVTFENRYAVSEPLGNATTILPSGIAPPAKAWSTDRLVKFDIRPSGTTLAVGTTSSTTDNITHSKLVAEQKIYGPLNVTTALTDLGAPTAAKSISAGFKFNW